MAQPGPGVMLAVQAPQSRRGGCGLGEPPFPNPPAHSDLVLNAQHASQAPHPGGWEPGAEPTTALSSLFQQRSVFSVNALFTVAPKDSASSRNL